MGKQEAPKEEKKSESKEAGAPKGGHSTPGGSHGGPSAHPSPSAKVPFNAKIGCLALGCKDKDVRLSFCEEHFKQFKFGLITKTGQKVMDYEKKFEHYQKWLSAQRVA